MKTPRIAGCFAIPLFLWLTFYFWSKSNERELSPQEMILLAFAVTGFFATFYFVFVWREL